MGSKLYTMMSLAINITNNDIKSYLKVPNILSLCSEFLATFLKTQEPLFVSEFHVMYTCWSSSVTNQKVLHLLFHDASKVELDYHHFHIMPTKR